MFSRNFKQELNGIEKDNLADAYVHINFKSRSMPS